MDATEFDLLIETQAKRALNVPSTPAYVYSESVLQTAARQAATIAIQANCELLYTLKACAIAPVLESLAPFIRGFAASSVFEARVAKSVKLHNHSLHCYSPAYPRSDMEATLTIADYVSLNSFTQLETALSLNAEATSLGLRVNPELSFALDYRYDPSRPRSKLGAPLSSLEKIPRMPESMQGIHIHNNCESDDLRQLALSADAITGVISGMDNPRWVNLGGGYYLGPETDPAPLIQAADRLRSEFGVRVFIEPGTALTQQAGFLVSETLDAFPNDGADIVVLDTSTSHMPEVFEYQYAPPVTAETEEGRHPVHLVGRSCLAGDTFGEYGFSATPRIGERVAIMNAGSYSHSRAVPFNGIPVPSVYMLREDGSFDLAAGYDYDQFSARNGVTPIAAC